MSRRRRASSPSPSPSTSSTIHIDLTQDASPAPPSATVSDDSSRASSRRSKRHHHHHKPHHTGLTAGYAPHDRRFMAAFRRVHTRRDRLYTDQGMMERLSHHEERPSLWPIAWTLSNVLVMVVVVVATGVVLHLCHAFYCDMMRKTTSRAHHLQREAWQCRQQLRANECDQVSSPALSRLCLEWRQCASRGDSAFRYAFSLAVFAEIMADMFNAFASTISSMGVVVASVLAALTLCLASILFRTCATYSEPLSPLFHEQYWRRPSAQSLPPAAAAATVANSSSKPLLTWGAGNNNNNK